MNELLQRLLNTRGLDWSDPSVSFGFERPLPAWAWAGVVIAAVGVAAWSYSRLAGSAWARWSLAGVRALLLLLLVALLCGPQLVKREDLSENDWVLVLVDRSASLGVEDAPALSGASPDPTQSPRRTREAQLESALSASAPMWSSLTKDRTVVWLGFDSGVYDLAAAASAGSAAASTGVPKLTPPKGQRTALGVALDQALARAAARPLAGVVIVSDGRSIDEPSRQAVRRLESERIPVVAVALGSEQPVGDLALRKVDAPRIAFVSDLTPVRVEVERTGGGATSARVRLVDTSTGRLLDEKTVEFKDAGPNSVARTSLATRGDAAGSSNWAVEIVPDGLGASGGGGGGDLIASNNRAEMTVEMIDRPLRVLFVDGYPRWEQRYVKNLLVREKSISCSTLILAPDKKFIQEGDVELDALPDSPERWAEFDAVILGDVSPDVFTRDQLMQLKEHVARRGGGLIWIAGPSFTPLAWTGTVLGDLLPFQKDAADGTTLAAPALMKPTPEAERLGLLRLSAPEDEQPWPAALATFETGWSQLHWVQRIEPARLKPTTEVLATADLGPSARRSAERPFPILMTMKYGAGRVIYNATDEVWRWRYARGETLYERYWTPMIRLLGRDALSRSGQSAVLEVSPNRAVVDQPVRVSVQLLDQSLMDLGLGSIIVKVAPKKSLDGTEPAVAPVELTLRAEQPGTAPGEAAAGASSGGVRTYSTVWLPTEAGEYRVQLADSALAGRVPAGSLETEARVFLPDDELRSPDANHALLASLAQRTGGVVLKPEEMASIPSHLPNRKMRVVNESAQPLWDTPLALLLSVLLLTAEWVCRRVIRLV